MGPLSKSTPLSFAWRECIFTGLLAAVLAVLVLRLWHADLSVPFGYFGDSVAMAATVKGVIENTWFFTNPALGAPYGQTFADYPMSDYTHFALLKILGTVAPTSAWAINVYFLLSFPLTAAISMWVLRRLGLSVWASVLSSMLFTFLPFHLYRSTHHLFSSVYFCIPVVIYIALRFAAGSGVFFGAAQSRHRSWVALVIFVIVVGGTGVYGVFFALVFMFIGVCYGFIRYKAIAPVREALIIGSGLIVATIIATAPTLIYAHEHGKNAIVADRRSNEAEIYGLRITQLLMPTANHRLAPFSALRLWYDAEGTGIPVNENGTASLGIFGAAGFLLLLIYVCVGRQNVVLQATSVLNLWAVLLATMGGLSSIVAFMITPKIRAYNRISPYIGFLALVAVAISVDVLVQRWPRMSSRYVLYGLVTALLTAGILDQTSNMNVPDYEGVDRAFGEDRKFVNQIEQVMPPGAMIFQLPYVPWPEHPAVHSLSSYELLRGYLHSKTLRWSYGAMKGRPGDFWIQYVSSRPIAEMVDMIAIAGFSGIYLDRRGYPDTTFETALNAMIGKPAVTSSDGTRVFYSLLEYTRSLQRSYSQDDWQRMGSAILRPTFATWTEGCSVAESSADTRWRWCENHASLALYNPDTKPRQIRITGNVDTGVAQPSTLHMETPNSSVSLNLTGQSAVRIDQPLALQPGTTVVQFESNAARLVAPGDPRKLVIRLSNFEIADHGKPVAFRWESGCSVEERAAAQEWRWCTEDASLTARNEDSVVKQVALDLSFYLGVDKGARFQVSAPGSSDSVQLGSGAQSFRRVLALPPGISRVHLMTDAEPLRVPGDPRKLVFRVVRFYTVDLQSPPVIYTN